MNPTAVAVPTRIRVFVGCFLGIVVLFGLVGFEAWPLTAFRLFSVARDDTRTSWEARTVDAEGRETAFGQRTCRSAIDWRSGRSPSSRAPATRRRDDVCRGIARVPGCRPRGRGVRVYRVREHIRRPAASG